MKAVVKNPSIKTRRPPAGCSALLSNICATAASADTLCQKSNVPANVRKIGLLSEEILNEYIRFPGSARAAGAARYS